MVLAGREAEDPPGGHVQDRGQVELALTGLYLGAAAVPLDVDLLRGEVPLDQVRRAPAALPGRVADRRLRLRRGARPCSRVSAATVFLPTFPPASRRSAVIRGDPYVPRWEANSRRTSAASAARGRRSTPSLHLQNQGRDTPSARQAAGCGI